MDYEKLPDSLKSWCDEIASFTDDDRRYQVRREAGEKIYKIYTPLLESHSEKEAENLTKEKLGSAQEAWQIYSQKRRKNFLLASSVLISVIVLLDVLYVVFFLFANMHWIFQMPVEALVTINVVLIVVIFSTVRQARQKNKADR